jgi:hypothetical protein
LLSLPDWWRILDSAQQHSLRIAGLFSFKTLGNISNAGVICINQNCTKCQSGLYLHMLSTIQREIRKASSRDPLSRPSPFHISSIKGSKPASRTKSRYPSRSPIILPMAHAASCKINRYLSSNSSRWMIK